MNSKTPFFTSKGRFHRWLRKVLALVIFVSIFCSIYIIRHRYCLSQISGYQQWTSQTYEKPEFPELSAQEIVQLGWAQRQDNSSHNSYLTFTEEKRPGTIRIGVFGDSHVYGSEVAPGHDFPSQLQGMFEHTGVNNVEVINFGVKAYGQHQAFLMWKYLGKNYDLDYVVFMPYSWHATSRDNSFILDNHEFNPIHARFILEGDSLKFLPVEGTTRLEATREYFGLIPKWKYLRYDFKMPFSLRILLPSFFHNRSNPLYYKLKFTQGQEIFNTYASLFEEVARKAKNVIVIANEKEIYSLGTQVQAENVYFLKSDIHDIVTKDLSSLYRAPRSHYSALGNYLRAQELCDLLTGKASANFKFIEISPTLLDQNIETAQKAKPLFAYDDIDVRIADFSAANLVVHKKGAPVFRFDDNLNFQKDKIVSLLCSPGPDLYYAPLPFMLNDGDSLYISFKLNGQTVRTTIGVVNSPQKVVGKVTLLESQILKSGKNWHLQIENGDFINNVSLTAKGDLEQIYLCIGNRIALNGESQSKKSLTSFLDMFSGATERAISVSFRPIASKFAYLRAGAGQTIDLHKLTASRGSLDLTATDKDGSVQRFPIGSYYIRESKSEKFDPLYPRPFSEVTLSLR